MSRDKEKLELKAYKKELREKAADEREARTGMRQSTGAMVAKIVIGVMFIVGSFATPEGGEWSIGYCLVGITLGVGLAACGVIPYINAKKKREHEELKEILSTPLQTYGEAELQQAMERVEKQSETEAQQKDETPEMQELRKYKEMLDQGLINEKDYEKKKKKILGL